MDENIDNEETTKLTFLDALIMPTSIQYMDFTSLSYYLTINKLTCKTSTEKRSGFWLAVCNSFAASYGLYTFGYNDLLCINAKKYFFNELLIAKNKFSSTVDTNTTSFNIKVCARFRPGQRNNENLNLPLHQFLKVRRKNIKESAAADNNKCLVGEPEPDEYLDPLLRTLMIDPVQLRTSGKILDRSCAVQCILRGGRDPFNQKRLTLADLIPQPELAKKIKEWKDNKKVDISISMNDVKTLADETASDPHLLAILMEADRLSSLSNRAQKEARSERLHNFEGNEHNNDNDNDDIYIEEEFNENNTSNHDVIYSENDENINSNLLDRSSSSNKSVRDSDNDNGLWKKNSESARVVDINDKKSCVSMHIGGAGVRNFSFACVNDGSTNQSKTYQTSAQDSIMAALNGFNSCLLAYGQTGSGKTYTLFGPEGVLDVDANALDYKSIDNTGIVIRACGELLCAKERMKSIGVNLSLSAQFVEIYNEEVVDLLNGRAISVRRDTGELVGAVEAAFDSLSEAMDIIRLGQARKRFAATAMNERSSRSHTAFIVQLVQIKRDHSDDEKIVKSALHLVDLAGSERIKKSQAIGKNKVEAVNINSSLLVLGKVIAALVESKSHIPFLESKLTTMLKSAFGGNCKTTAIINCRSDDSNGDETLQSLRFGERCSMISNTAKQAASSLESTITALNEALSRVEAQIISLDNRGKQHLDSYQKVKNSFIQMQRKRDELLKQANMNNNATNEMQTNTNMK